MSSLAVIDHAPTAALAPLSDTLTVWREAAELAKAIARTDFVPSALRNKPEAVTACILMGHEVGIGPMQALSKIHVIDGRPAMASELMRALVLAHGHEIWFEDLNNTRAVICGHRATSDHVSKVTWTMDDAKKANLSGKQNWTRYPRAMLTARATGELCRMIFADVLGGISYTPEEIDDGIVVDATTVGDDDGAEAPKAITRKAAPPRKATAAKKAAPAREPTEAAGPPPLPGDEDAGAEPAEVVTKRAQRIAMAARDAGLDHHFVISAVTNGVKTSAKTVTAEEAAEVLQAFHDVTDGTLELIEEDGEWRLVPGNTVQRDEENESTDDPSLSSAASAYTTEEWKQYLRDNGVRLGDFIREAQRRAEEQGLDSPGSIATLPSELAGDMADWVEQQQGESQ